MQAKMTSLKAEVVARAMSEISPTRAAIRSRGLASMALAALGPAAMVSVLDWSSLGHRPAGLVAATSTGALASSAIATWAALGGKGVVGRPRLWLAFAACSTPALLATWKIALSQAVEGMALPVARHPGFRCLALTLLLACWPFGVLLSFWRRCDAIHPRSLGAALGAACGAYAAFWVDLWCPAGDPAHVLLGHALPVALFAVMGVVAGQQILAVRLR